MLNRRLVAWVFVGTGLVSFFLWWRNQTVWTGRHTISFDLSEVGVKLSPTEVDEEGEGRLKLKLKIQELVATASGTYSWYVYRLETGVGYGDREKESMPGASIMKVPAMMAALKQAREGKINLVVDEIKLLERDRATGSGPLQFAKAGTKVTWDRLLTELGKKSDNTAWMALNRSLGVKTIEDMILALGMRDTNYVKGTTTAWDVAKMWAKAFGDKEIGSGGWGLMSKYLTDSIYEDRIPMGLPREGVRVVHKVGTLEGVWSDGGVVDCETQCDWEPYVLVILNEGVKRSEAELVVPKIAKEVWDFESGRKRL